MGLIMHKYDFRQNIKENIDFDTQRRFKFLFIFEDI